MSSEASWWKRKKPEPPAPPPVKKRVSNPRLEQIRAEIKRQVDEAKVRVDATLERLAQKEAS